MSEHETRDRYATLREALVDADRVAGDLVTVTEDAQALLVDAVRVQFLARRLQDLARGCLDAEQRAHAPGRAEGHA